MMARTTQKAVRFSIGFMGPSLARATAISSLLTETSFVGRKRIMIINMVMMLAMTIGRPMTLSHVIHPTVTGAVLAAARGLMEASPVRKIMETGMDAVKTVNPILTASSCGMPALLMTTAMTDMIRKARGQGWGINSVRMKVSTKMETMMLRKFVTYLGTWICTSTQCVHPGRIP